MRTISAAQEQILTHPDATVHVRVLVSEDSWSTSVDLTNLENRNWVLGFNRREDLGSSWTTADVDLNLIDGDLNLSPLMPNSKLNLEYSASTSLLAVGHLIRIYTAIIPPYETPQSSDWQWVFDGAIESWQTNVPADNPPTLRLELIDVWGAAKCEYVEEERTYPKSPPNLVDATINDVLTDWSSVTSSINAIGATPSATVSAYNQQIEPVYQSINRIAEKTGYRIEWRYDTSFNDFRLSLYAPSAAPSVQRTFYKWQYLSNLSVGLSRENVRNVIRTVYPNAAKGRKEDDILITNPSSISKYGRRFMGLSEEESSQIDTLSEATTLGNSALRSLKDPTGVQSVTLPYIWYAQLNDYYRLSGDNISFSGTVDGAVVGIRDSVVVGGIATTILDIEGVPNVKSVTRLAEQRHYVYTQGTARNIGRFVSRKGNLAVNGDFSSWN